MPITGLDAQISLASAVAFLAVFFLVRPALGNSAALIVSFVKVALPLGYFVTAFQPQWTFLDDLYYVHQGEVLLSRGYHPFLSLFDKGMWATLVGMASGLHILYGWWNFLAQWLFGTYYWSPIFLNVIASAVAARGLFIFLGHGGWARESAWAATLFFALHWEVLAWCSVSNLKDILVMTLMMYQMVAMEGLARARRRRFAGIAQLAFCVVMLGFVRFYLPVILFAAFFAWLFVTRAVAVSRMKLAVMVLLVAGAALSVLSMRLQGTAEEVAPLSAFTGILRVIVTPQPWSIDEAFGFMTLPSVMHWLLLPVLPFGAYALWRDKGIGRLVLIIVATLVFFYAIVPDLQGPRSRVQMLPLIAVLQYRGLLMLIGFGSGRRGSESTMVSASAAAT